MLDIHGAGRPRSRSTSVISLRLPHITVEVDNAPVGARTASEQAGQQNLDLSPTRSLPTPTIHIVDDLSSSPFAPHPVAARMSDDFRHNIQETPMAAVNTLHPDSKLHRRLTAQQETGSNVRSAATKREESFRGIGVVANANKWTSDQAKEIEYQPSCQSHHQIPTLKHQPSAALSYVSIILKRV